MRRTRTVAASSRATPGPPYRSTLTELGLYIGVSKISTKVDQVADVFYVRDIFGHKITSEDKLTEIRSKLITAIDEWV